MKLTDSNKIRDYVKEQINPYGKPFYGSVYEFGLKIMNYIDNMSTDYDADKVVKELEEIEQHCLDMSDWQGQSAICDAIEIVKQGVISDDVCEWRVCDEEANVYDTSCRNPHILIEGTPRENNYKFCPYCGKKIKAVE